MNLILLQPSELAADGTAHLRDHRARHLQSVLRVATGDRVRIGQLNGPRGVGIVRAVSTDCVELACAFEETMPTAPPIDLLLALPRPKVLKRLWAQLAALGIGRIMLTNAARVERNYFDTHVIHPDFYTPLLVEGLQQARDTRVPEVSIHRRFKPLVEDELTSLSDATVRLVAHPVAAQRASAALREAESQRVLLAIGPEGGWIPFELELLSGHGFQPVHFGDRTLRSDTACIAALSVVRERLAV